MPNRAVSRLVLAEFSEGTVIAAAREARAQLDAEVSVGIVFFSPDYAEPLEEFLELLRVYARIPLLVGCSGGGIIGTGKEAEDRSGFSLLLLSLPQTKLHVTEFSLADLDEAGGPEFWRARAGKTADATDGWVVFTNPNPSRFDTERWLTEWNRAYPGIPVLGGIASGGEDNIVVCHDGRAIAGGAIVLGFSGGVALRTVVSQGCRPIGEPLTITGVKQQNLLLSLGSKPAYSVLNAVFNGLTKNEKDRARNNLFAGLAMSEYVEEYKRGDFLIRSILGADPDAGAVAIASPLRVGQTLQYQLRDRDSADEDLRELCVSLEEDGAHPFASLLFACNGRGQGLFNVPDHDAGVFAEIFGPHASAGFFCNGEIGPVGKQSFVHGYTASSGLFCDAQPLL